MNWWSNSEPSLWLRRTISFCGYSHSLHKISIVRPAAMHVESSAWKWSVVRCGILVGSVVRCSKPEDPQARLWNFGNQSTALFYPTVSFRFQVPIELLEDGPLRLVWWIWYAHKRGHAISSRIQNLSNLSTYRLPTLAASPVPGLLADKFRLRSYC